jgi:uncharacterized membrane protein YeaQ/YmgE (transglycosylase-associated protein family)
MRDLLLAVIGLVAAGVAVWQIMAYYQNKGDVVLHFVVAVICAIIALACGGLFLSKRVNKTEEIHITE